VDRPELSFKTSSQRVGGCGKLPHVDGLQRSYGSQAEILKACGRLEEAVALLKTQKALSLELGNPSGMAYCYWNWHAAATRLCAGGVGEDDDRR